jgi:hypothetical protein
MNNIEVVSISKINLYITQEVEVKFYKYNIVK